MTGQEEKPNLLLIVPTLRQGGFERVCVETARIMARDMNVTLAVFDTRDAHYEVTGAEVIDLKMPAGGGVIAKTLRMFRRAARIKQIKKEKKIDVSYSFGLSANLVNARARTGDLVLTGLRSFLDFDAPNRMRSVLSGTDVMVSCSRGMEKKLQKEYGFTKTALLYNPVDTDRVGAQADDSAIDMPFPEIASARHRGEDSVMIVSMGRDDDAKGYWHLLKAFADLYRQNPASRLMIIGDGMFAREKELAQNLGIADAVCFTGVKKNPFPYLAYGDLFVLSSNKEGFPNALLEAMALGLPVIAADCETGPREILLSGEQLAALERRFPDGVSTRDVAEGGCGLLVPDMSAVPDYDAKRILPDDRMLSTAMKRMLADRGMMRRYSMRAKERAADFSERRYRDALTQIIRTHRGER